MAPTCAFNNCRDPCTSTCRASADESRSPLLLRYESQELAAQATALLVRHFEQLKALFAAGRQIQILSRQRMVDSLLVLDDLVTRLSKLTSNRRLYAHELYEAAWLLGALTSRCYEDEDDDAQVHGDGVSLARSAMTKKLTVDVSDRLCLTCFGIVQVSEGSAQVTFKEVGLEGMLVAADATIPMEHDSVWISGTSYKVKHSDLDTKTLELDRPVTGLDGEKEAWLQVEAQVFQPCHDKQVQCAHTHAQCD